MGDVETSRRLAVLSHQNGLHLTPIQQVVRAASEFSADIKIHFNDKVADAKSAMELMLLGATQGSQLAVEGVGPNAQDAVEAVARVLETSPD